MTCTSTWTRRGAANHRRIAAAATIIDAPAMIHGARRARAIAIGVTAPLLTALPPIAWRSALSTSASRFAVASSALPAAARITVATSSSARSSALIAGGVRPASVLSTRSANVFACARSAGVASSSGDGTEPVKMSSSSRLVAMSFLGYVGTEMLAEGAHGAEQEHVERADRDVQALRAVLARELLNEPELDRESIALGEHVERLVDLDPVRAALLVGHQLGIRVRVRIGLHRHLVNERIREPARALRLAMDVEHLVDRDLAQPRIDRLSLPREAPDLLARGRQRIASHLFGRCGIAEARQDHRAGQRLCIAFEDRSQRVEVSGLGLLDQTLLFFKLDSSGWFGGRGHLINASRDRSLQALGSRRIGPRPARGHGRGP